MRLPYATLVLLSIACAPRYSTAALGNYNEFEPFMTSPPMMPLRVESTYDVEIKRQAFVTLIAIVPPAGGYEDRPVVFSALYPLYDTDKLQFAPGRHRLRPHRTELTIPPNCSSAERPALEGCRRVTQL